MAPCSLSGVIQVYRKPPTSHIDLKRRYLHPYLNSNLHCSCFIKSVLTLKSEVAAWAQTHIQVVNNIFLKSIWGSRGFQRLGLCRTSCNFTVVCENAARRVLLWRSRNVFMDKKHHLTLHLHEGVDNHWSFICGRTVPLNMFTVLQSSHSSAEEGKFHGAHL